MRITLLILTCFFLFFGVRPVFAVTVTTSNIPSSISDQTFDINVSVTGASAGTNYLRIDLFKDGSINYFGETYNNNSWYSGSTGTQYFPITIVSGQTWNGSVQGKVGTPTSTEYPGLGAYKLRIRRYTSSGYSQVSSDQQTPKDITIAFTTPSPTPSPTPSTSPSPNSSSSPSPFSTTSSSSTFTISNTPSQIDSTETFNVVVNLSLSGKPNTTFYLKGAFKKKDGTNYFGLTKVGNSWIKNSIKYQDQYKITTNGEGNWSGNLEIRPDILDSGYEGAGEYIFKVGRYTEDGSLSWSNESVIKINAQEVILEEEDDSEVLGVTGSQRKKDTPISLKDAEYSLEKYIKIATPAAKATTSSNRQTVVKGESRTNYLNWVGLFMTACGIGLFAFVYLRSKDLREAIFNIFGKRN
ncbi:hypothetical protein HYS96_02120 [Candidatus Daviesbacteria bacterium]|nr:hypothetical protein [Candidatus Daviesbacteria bacterium]